MGYYSDLLKARINDDIIEQSAKPSLISRGLDTGLDVLGTAGRILDTPGSILRGIIAGEPGRAVTGILNAKDRVSGAELVGGARNKFTWGGFGAEVALDPLNLLSFGTLGAAGKAAKAASKLDPLIAVQKGLTKVEAGANVAERLAQNEKRLAQLLKESGGVKYGKTLEEQAKLGQRSLVAFDVPFTKINVPLIKGSRAFKGLDKLRAVTPSSHILNTVFNSNYVPEARRTLSPEEAALKTEFRNLSREGEATGSKIQQMLKSKLVEIANKNKLSLDDILTEFGKAAEVKGYKSPIDGIGDLAKVYRNIEDSNLKRGMYHGITGLRELKNDKIYHVYRRITPQALKWMREKKMGERALMDKIINTVNVAVPGFAAKRKLFRDVPMHQVNDLIKQKFGVPFDFFSKDIIDNLAAATVDQEQAIAQSKVFNTALNMFGKKGVKGETRSIAKLLTELNPKKKGRLAGPITSKLFSIVPERFNTRELVDDQGKVRFSTTQASSKEALEAAGIIAKNNKDVDRLLKLRTKLHDILKNATKEETEAAQRLHVVLDKNGLGGFKHLPPEALLKQPELVAHPNKAEIIKELAKVGTVNSLAKAARTSVEKLGNVVDKRFKGVPALGSSNPIGTMFKGGSHTNQEIKNYLNWNNKLYHGTGSIAKERIEESGFMLPKKQGDNWASSQLVKGKRQVLFTPKESIAKGYAEEAANNLPGTQESLRQSSKHYSVLGVAAQRFKEAWPTYQFGVNFTPYTRRSPEQIAGDIETIKMVFSKNKEDGYKQFVARSGEGRPLTDPKEAREIFDYFWDNHDHFQKEFDDLQRQVPSLLQAKLTDLIKYDIMHPEYKQTLKYAKEGMPFGKFRLSDFPQIARTASNDFNSLPQLGNKVVPSKLVKEVGGFDPATGIIHLEPKQLASKLKLKITRKDKILDIDKSATAKEIDKYLRSEGLHTHVDKDVYQSVKQILTTTKDPAFAAPALRLLDNINSVYRAALTTFFPAYHTRNAMNGAFMNMLAGVVNPERYKEAFSKLKNISDAEYIKLSGLGVLGKGLHEETQHLIENSTWFQQKHGTFMRAYSKMRRLGQYVDNVNRYTLYLAKKAEGFTDNEAAEMVKKYHFDYSDLTGTEKLALRRGVLFYTFMRNNVPLMLKTIVENPRAIQIYNRLSGKTNSNIEMPNWLNDALFIGDNKVVGLGLSPQDLTKFDTHGGGLQRFAQLLTSQLTPAITAPLESITGTSLYYGQPREGPWYANALKSSPLSRLVSTGERVAERPLPELTRLMTGVNYRELKPKDIKKSNQIDLVKKKLEELVRAGRAKPTTVYYGDDEQTKVLNSALRKLYSQ